MSRSHLPTRDPRSGEPLPVIDDSCVPWSSGAGTWVGLLVEEHRLDALDTPPFEVPVHSVTIHLSGPAEVEHKVAGEYRRRVFRRGDLSFFPAGATRQLRHRRRSVLIVALTSETVGDAARAARVDPARSLVERHHLRDPQIEHIALALKAEAEAGYTSGRVYGESLGMALAAHLVAHYADGGASPAPRKGGMAPQALRRVVEYVQEHLADDVHLATLAQVAGLSAHRFAHNFKRATGLAPHQYVIRERVERAKHLLRDSDASVAEIALAVGCGSPSRFAWLFRRAAGATPSAYRASFR